MGGWRVCAIRPFSGPVLVLEVPASNASILAIAAATIVFDRLLDRGELGLEAFAK